jgi:hypothetical protein
MYMVEASLYNPILVGWFSNLNLCPPARPASKCEGETAKGITRSAQAKRGRLGTDAGERPRGPSHAPRAAHLRSRYVVIAHGDVSFACAIPVA